MVFPWEVRVSEFWYLLSPSSSFLSMDDTLTNVQFLLRRQNRQGISFCIFRWLCRTVESISGSIAQSHIVGIGSLLHNNIMTQVYKSFIFDLTMQVNHKKMSHSSHFLFALILKGRDRRWTYMWKIRAIRELNPGPLVPETRIIPLDQSPAWSKYWNDFI